MNWLGLTAAIGNMIISGIISVVTKSLVKRIHIALILVIQTIVGWLGFLLITVIMGDFMEMFQIGIYPFLAFVSAAILGMVFGNFMYMKSLELVGVSKAYPIAMTYPLLTYIFEIAFLGGSFLWTKLFGILFVIIGVVFIALSRVNEAKIEDEIEDEEDTLGDSEKMLSVEKETNLVTDSKDTPTIVDKVELPESNKKELNKSILGIFLAIICTLTWSSGTTLIKYGLEKTAVDIIPISGARMLFLIPVSVALLFISKGHKSKLKPNWKIIAIVALTGLLSNVVANIFYLFSIDTIGTSTPAAIAASGPLIATPLSILFLKEKVDWKIIIGTILTITGNIVVILF